MALPIPIGGAGPRATNRSQGVCRWGFSSAMVIGWILAMTAPGMAEGKRGLDFNRDIRPILSEHCFKCHGPDSAGRKGGKPGQGGLRLDHLEGATADLGGKQAIVVKNPDQSELVRRIETQDLDDLMPPPKSGPRLSSKELDTLKQWIREGAGYSEHWAYHPPMRPQVPEVSKTDWVRNPVDAFILARLDREKLQPSPELDRASLLRRVSLDLTGLPPSLEMAQEFEADTEKGAFERAVDRLLKSDAYGEHWARLWLDQARYADSSGYADDPARTIWAYRDYVIRALNTNKPFDQFTLEQLAGDLLGNPTEEQLIATALHRNTMTNNEGGTSDEEYRNVAIVDRVNTTMSVWMGTTMACAQCHDHKYDPISQEDYFKMFAILNNCADADRTDESPVMPLYTEEQKQKRSGLQTELASLDAKASTVTAELREEQARWEERMLPELKWDTRKPRTMRSEAGAKYKIKDDGSVEIDRGGVIDTYTLDFGPLGESPVSAVRIEALPDDRPPGRGVGHAGGNFVLTAVYAESVSESREPIRGRYLRIELPGREKMLSLAEVQVFSGSNNIARGGVATQSSTAYGGTADRAIDGVTDGDYEKAKSTTHTESSQFPWWEVDLKSMSSVDRIVIWNRTDGAQERLKGFKVRLLDDAKRPVWERRVDNVPNPSAEWSPYRSTEVHFDAAVADFTQKGTDATVVIGNRDASGAGWSVAPQLGVPHALHLLPDAPFRTGSYSNLVVSLQQASKFENATMAHVRLSTSEDERAREMLRIPASTLAALRTPKKDRSEAQKSELERYHLSVTPLLASVRDRRVQVRADLDGIKPYTTIPVLKELAGAERRVTHLQRRGNFMDLGAVVPAGLPSTWSGRSAQGEPSASGAADRLSLARWLVSPSNPLTARVTVNRLWETLFGIGLVRTSEEFGSQGEAPSHPELLDWLAVELVESKWDLKAMLKIMVTSATYRQTSKVSPEQVSRDPDNRLLARGPRFRLGAEMIRDQALYVSGLLSRKMYGPPVKPPQPKLGLSAAFGSGTDWETSTGEDRFRRALYTTWRRSNPYPSMATFDAPNREVCTVRRDRSNTPLQALVTLNDPVYIEAAQALARRMIAVGASPAAKVRHGFRLCLSREPDEQEVASLLRLYARAYERYVSDHNRAVEMASNPIGPVPKGAESAEVAAWTVVGNVLLNLDEMLMKR